MVEKKRFIHFCVVELVQQLQCIIVCDRKLEGERDKYEENQQTKGMMDEACGKLICEQLFTALD